MYRVEVHKFIARVNLIFYRAGVWHQEDEETVAAWILKLFYSIYFFILLVALLAGPLTSDNIDNIIFSLQTSLITTVLLSKLLLIIWRQDEVLELLKRLCVHSVEEHDEFTLINNKLKDLMEFVAAFLSSTYLCGTCCTLVVPLLRKERKLFFEIGFPLDYKNDEFAYWMAVTFIFTEFIIMTVSWLFTVVIWYLMTNCGLRYDVLGQQIKKMGKIKANQLRKKLSDTETDELYRADFLEAIKSHNYKEYKWSRSCNIRNFNILSF